MIHKKCVFCPIAQTFLLLGPLLPAYNFSATMATTYSTYRLRAVASIKFLAIENMPPHFLAHVYYGQTAAWIRIPLSTEVGLSPGDTVLDGDPPAPYGKGHSSPCNSRSTALASIPVGPHYTHNPYCRLGSAWWVALAAVLWTSETSLV